MRKLAKKIALITVLICAMALCQTCAFADSAFEPSPGGIFIFQQTLVLKDSCYVPNLDFEYSVLPVKDTDGTWNLFVPCEENGVTGTPTVKKAEYRNSDEKDKFPDIELEDGSKAVTKDD